MKNLHSLKVVRKPKLTAREMDEVVGFLDRFENSHPIFILTNGSIPRIFYRYNGNGVLTPVALGLYSTFKRSAFSWDRVTLIDHL